MRVVLLGVGLALLAGCGGGGGSVGLGSTPTPPTGGATPTPTAVSNSTITDLRVSQSFTNYASNTQVAFNLASGTTIAGKGSQTPLTVSYDAASQIYTVSGVISDSFGPTEKQQSTDTGQQRFVKRGTGQNTYLTLATTPYTGTTPNRYVALGYVQRNTLSTDRQDTDFTAFAYGLETPASSVPRTGTAIWATDVFGIESLPGSEPASFSGRGRFDVDFINGMYSTTTSFTRTGLVTGKGIVGGGLDLTGGGHLTASDGTFSGNIVYSASGLKIVGAFSGRFFGPGAEEIGASFGGALSDGSAFNGALTGQRDASLSPVNISFARLVAPQLFYADATTLTVRIPHASGTPAISDYPGQLGTAVSRSQYTDKTSGNVSFGPPTSNLPGGDFTVTSIVAGDPNYTSYAKSFNGQQTRLDVYKTGSDNREFALTYASYGRYATSTDGDPFQSEADRVFFVFGFNSPTGLFAGRTGIATYAGLAYGAGATPSGSFVEVTGTSRLTVDFGAASLSGTLALLGNGGAIDYGSFAFKGPLFTYGSSGRGDISRSGGVGIGTMLANFYGPAANEAGGLFQLKVPDGVGADTRINGAFLAKKQ